MLLAVQAVIATYLKGIIKTIFRGIRKGSPDFVFVEERMRRAENILAEARANNRRKTLSEIREDLHSVTSEGTSMTIKAVKETANAGNYLGKDDCDDTGIFSDAYGTGMSTAGVEKKTLGVAYKTTKRVEENSARLFRRHRESDMRGRGIGFDGSHTTEVKRKMRQAALNKVKKTELLARDFANKAKAVSGNIVMLVKLAAKSIMALFTALFANLSTVLITIVISVVVVVSFLSALLPSWLREEHRISRDHSADYYVNEVTLEEYITEKTNQWREMILLENTEDAWYIIWHGNGRTEFEPDWEGCLTEFDEWLDGKYLPGDVIAPEDIQVLDGLLVKYSDYMVTIEYFDFYEFDAYSCNGVFDIREGFTREEIGGLEWYADLDYMEAFWTVEVDGEMKLWAPSVVVWTKS